MSGNFPYLTLIILLPAAAAVVLALSSLDKRFSKEFADVVAIGTSLVVLIFSIAAVVDMSSPGPGGFQRSPATPSTAAPSWACAGT